MRSPTAPVLGMLIVVLAAGCADEERPTTAPSPSTSSATPSFPAASSSGRPGASSSAASPAQSGSVQPTEAPTGSVTPPPGAEMPPTEEGSSSGPALPGLDVDPGALVQTPLPAAGAARGQLVKGFPRSMRPLRRSRVLTSSVSPSGSRLQVALEASTAAGVDRVLLAYRTRFARLGMVEEDVQSVQGSHSSGFSRGDSSVVVTVRAGGGRTTYTVYGVLRADG